MTYDYDLLVIGAGSGGVRASRMASQQGKKVAVIEGSDLGGTCVNLGCVPKKLFVYASHYQEDFQDAKAFGWEAADPSFNWQTLLENKNAEILRLNGIYNNILTNAGVEIIKGFATFEDQNTLRVGAELYTAEKIVVCPGSHAYVPNFPGSEHAIVSDHAFHLKELPKDMVIVGGGYIATEFTGILHGIGVEVTQLYRGELFLRGFDLDLRQHVAEEMQKKGIDLQFNTDVTSIEKLANGKLLLTLKDGSQKETSCVMYATGRVPNVERLNLEKAGIETHKGAIVVDENYKTNRSHIYAIGDVINKKQLTPVALAEAMHVVADLCGGTKRDIDYDIIPSAVFCQPNIGTVGITEEQSEERFPSDFEVYRSAFRPMKNTLSGNPERTLMKLIVQKSTQRILGLHMAGPDAAEITQGFAVAIKAGATKEDFDTTIGIHPSAAEEFVTMRTPV